MAKDTLGIDHHVVFGESAAGSLKQGYHRFTGDLIQSRLTVLPDDLNFGPISDLECGQGLRARVEWLFQHLSKDDFYELVFSSVCEAQGRTKLSFEDATRVQEAYFNQLYERQQTISLLPDGSSIMIWCADRAGDQTGLRFLMHLLRSKDCDVFVIDTSQKMEDDAYFRVLRASSVSPEKIEKLLLNDTRHHFSMEERETFANDWIRLAEAPFGLRLFTNGEWLNVSEDYYDNVLISCARALHEEPVMKRWIKALRLIGEVILHEGPDISDFYIDYRLRTLIQKGLFEAEGILDTMQTYRVRLQNI
ncbi:DUF3658 domain-containing protein [Camelliibacillus cellulosilyticus]|uniref:DUF3658 domain-containing protein n=1 Tax=Camelliibacillus cellulosilyticus TaxID=2174486 RepID=A0ABV9GJD1_9BACL